LLSRIPRPTACLCARRSPLVEPQRRGTALTGEIPWRPAGQGRPPRRAGRPPPRPVNRALSHTGTARENCGRCAMRAEGCTPCLSRCSGRVRERTSRAKEPRGCPLTRTSNALRLWRARFRASRCAIFIIGITNQVLATRRVYAERSAERSRTSGERSPASRWSAQRTSSGTHGMEWVVQAQKRASQLRERKTRPLPKIRPDRILRPGQARLRRAPKRSRHLTVNEVIHAQTRMEQCIRARVSSKCQAGPSLSDGGRDAADGRIAVHSSDGRATAPG
jgi:hypothetical protein